MKSSNTPLEWGHQLKDQAVRSRVVELWKTRLIEDPCAISIGDISPFQVFMERLLVSLSESLSPNPPWDTTSPELRDTVKVVSVIGGWLRETRHPISTAVLLFEHLQTTLLEAFDTDYVREVARLMWKLACSAVESYTLTARQQRTEEHEEFVRKSTPLVFIKQDVPALILLGSPRPHVLEELFERLHVATIRRDAPHVLLELTGVSRPSTSLSAGVLSLKDRSGMEARCIHIVAAAPRVNEALAQAGVVGPRFPRHDSLEEALDALSGRERAPF